MNYRLIAALVIIAALTVFYIWRINLDTSELPLEATTDLKNISYEIEGNEVALMNGLSEIETAPGSASKIVTKYFGNEVRYDFNGDGMEDVAFLLTQERGGSGTFFYIAAALGSATGYSGKNAIFLGDRIAPQATEFRDGQIIVNFAERKPGEPMTALPSVGVSKYFEIKNSQLVEINPIAKETLCPEGSRKAEICAQIYAPVCALVQIQCMRAPCDPVRETFSNSCEACKNSLVKSYLPGGCKK